MGGEGRVVAAAVFGMQHQRQIQQLRLQGRVAAVIAQHVQEVLRGGQFRLRGMNDEAALAIVIHIGLVAVGREQRESGHQFQALPQHIREGNIFRPVVEYIHRQDALGHRVHHVATGQLEQRVVDKVIGQRPV